GYGKRTPMEEFASHGRGGSGVRALRVTERTGPVAAARVVKPTDELMAISSGGLVIRTPVESISRLGRDTQGVSVMDLREGDKVASISITNGNGNGKKTEEQPAGNGEATEVVEASETVAVGVEVEDGQVDPSDV
ncbi:MAG: DNA gyrase C-terminal beta-propeller domain-containing protein, partial [Chloroflexota bacterium]